MVTKKPKGRVLKPEGVGEVVLPLTVRTVTVDGKRMTPAFYKPITQEELIDERIGDLRRNTGNKKRKRRRGNSMCDPSDIWTGKASS